MKIRILGSLAILAIGTSSLAQVGQPQDIGLTPRTGTIDVNTNYNNNALETGDITIGSNGNIMLAWEDDNGSIPLQDFEAVWTMYNNQGNLLTPPATVTNIPSAPCISTAETLSNWTYRAFFRSNGSLVPGYTGDFGGKAKGNQFGNGFAFCAGCDAIGCEVPELLAINVTTAEPGREVRRSWSCSTTTAAGMLRRAVPTWRGFCLFLTRIWRRLAVSGPGTLIFCPTETS